MTDKKQEPKTELEVDETINLTFPVEHDEKMITKLSMRRPNVRDHIWLDHQEKASKKNGETFGDFEKDATLYARLCDVDISIVQSLDMKDWGKLRERYLTCVGS